MLKYKLCILFLFILFLFSFNFVTAKNRSLPLLGKIIYLDPGHGGVDPGAIYKNIYEKKINLDITNKIKKQLEQEGATIYLTRYGDYDLSTINNSNRKRSDLSRRSNIINESKCDMYLSIHLNAEATGTWQGAQTFYDDVNKKNKVIADLIQTYLVKYLNTTRKSKKINNVYLNKNTTIPGILIEVGFISNGNDRYLLKQDSYQHKIANTITKAVIEYYKQK